MKRWRRRSRMRAQSDSVKCLIIAGAPDVFCAGNDLKDFVTMAGSGELAAPIVRFLHALARCGKPLVAAVSGAAVGVGTTMLLHCDQVIASDNAVLLTPFVSLGLVPEGGSSLIAPRLMGHARAFSLLVMGKPLRQSRRAMRASSTPWCRPPNSMRGRLRRQMKLLPCRPRALLRRAG